MAVEKGALPVFATRQMRIVRSVATEINIALLKMPLRQKAHPNPPSVAASNSNASCGNDSPESIISQLDTSPNGTTVFPNRTCLYVGSSGDHDPNLLRHLVYDDLGRFGDDLWTVWRVSNPDTELSYLAIYPNSHLDCHEEMFCQEKIDSMFGPHEDELIRLYYAHFHCSYPILESEEVFCAQVNSQKIPSSLLSIVLYHGSQFWCYSPLATTTQLHPNYEIIPWIFQSLTFEVRTPNLHVIQAILLFMQVIPGQIRAPNHPGFWPLTNMLVGTAQEIGLHVNPENWNILPSERKLRRILWWAVFTHDKWMAHTLGRPSHIVSHNWNVKPLALTDFADDENRISIEGISYAQAFISLCSLTRVLSDVCDNFYSIRAKSETSPTDVVLSKAEIYLSEIQKCTSKMPEITVESPIHDYTTKLMAFFVSLSALRAALSASNTQQSDRAGYTASSIIELIRDRLFPIFEALKTARSTGVWLSYMRGSLTMTGSLLITILLSSVEEQDFHDRQVLLVQYHNYLKSLGDLHTQTGHFEFTLLPLRRLNLIMEQLFGAERTT
ncbi:conserved hypothetical protein [Talaromyces marneffei ATCC 18224]|uniref:Xylanolytic transcriptional activator regulatory domain-containing protein n=1 Tax=Talaromyces marneffei (strain ATCC 18224 / CBS 334.59 / QM 7333) TaxID=441960 RepID=B6QK03_TALMQ|nr:conserved hypothetical protein [Talaromyces marneffei ATCC 18224]